MQQFRVMLNAGYLLLGTGLRGPLLILLLVAVRGVAVGQYIRIPPGNVATVSERRRAILCWDRRTCAWMARWSARQPWRSSRTDGHRQEDGQTVSQKIRQTNRQIGMGSGTDRTEILRLEVRVSRMQSEISLLVKTSLPPRFRRSTSSWPATVLVLIRSRRVLCSRKIL